MKAKKSTISTKSVKEPHFATALDYAMHVINDPTAGVLRRDAMAFQVLRYTQPRATIGATGKKAERNQAAREAAEKFAVPPVPRQSMQ